MRFCGRGSFRRRTDVCQGAACWIGRLVGSWWWARVTDVAKCRRQGLVVCRAALPVEGCCDARPGVALAPALIAPAAWRSRMVCASACSAGGRGRVRPRDGGGPDAAAVLSARRAGGELQAPDLSGRQRRLLEGVVLFAPEHRPEHARQFAGGGGDRDLVAAA